MKKKSVCWILVSWWVVIFPILIFYCGVGGFFICYALILPAVAGSIFGWLNILSKSDVQDRP